jgi:outer membrane lipoprotein SlyB
MRISIAIIALVTAFSLAGCSKGPEGNGDSYRLNQSKLRSRRASSDTPADNPAQA